MLFRSKNKKLTQNSVSNAVAPDAATAPDAQKEDTQAAVPEQQTKKRAIWTPSDDSVLISYLEDCFKAGNVSDNGFKKSVWEGAAEAVNKILSEGGLKTPKSCQDHFTSVSAYTYV